MTYQSWFLSYLKTCVTSIIQYSRLYDKIFHTKLSQSSIARSFFQTLICFFSLKHISLAAGYFYLRELRLSKTLSYSSWPGFHTFTLKLVQKFLKLHQQDSGQFFFDIYLIRLYNIQQHSSLSFTANSSFFFFYIYSLIDSFI